MLTNMTGKRRKMEYETQTKNSPYVNIGIKNTTHKVLATLAGQRTFDQFITDLLIHATTCREIRKDGNVLLNHEILSKFTRELKHAS